MWAMIPMLRVFWRENLRGIGEDPRWGLGGVAGKKMGPSGPRAQLVWSGPVSVVICSRSPSVDCYSAGEACIYAASARDARPTIAEEISVLRGLRGRFRGFCGG